MNNNYQKCIKVLSLLICVVLSQYSGFSKTAGDRVTNASLNNTIATVDDACSGTSSEASQGAFSTGYSYQFQTVGNSVNITFTLLDTDKVGVVAYLWQQTPFTEVQMPNVSGLTFATTITGQTPGATIHYGVKFAYAGGLSVTKYVEYVVGQNCGGGGPADTVAPTGFTAAVGTTTSSSVQLLLNGSDDSGSVIYNVAYGSSTATTTGVSGTQQAFVINNLTADTDYTFSITATDAAGNPAANNPIVLQASTLEAVANTACAGTSNAAAEGAFSTGYSYSFQTTGTSVTATFTLLDTDKVGVVAYLWQQTPFVEMQMTQSAGLTFTKTVTDLTPGTVVSYGVKFAYAGGLSRTVFYSYTVGDNCSGTVDTEAPAAFTATVGTITPTSVQFLLNGTDDSGSVIYTISYNGTSVTVSGNSGSQQAYVLNGLDADTAYTFTVTATDLAGNTAANNPISLQATTLGSSNSVPCTGTGTEAQQGTFSTGYSYSFQTINGSDVVVTVTMLDTDKVGVVAYLWTQTPFSEAQMQNVSGLTFTKTLTGQTPGATIGLAVKFAFAGGLSATAYIPYVVGQDCELPEDTEAPANFTATVGAITANTVELLLNGTDNSGTVVYNVTFGGQTMTFTGTSGVTTSVIITDLAPQTAYSFSVEAADAAGNEAANNAIVVDATTLMVDNDAPTGFTATVGTVTATSVQVVLNGTDNSGTVIYTITVNGQTTTVTGVSGEETTVTINNLSPEAVYSFTVTAADATGNAAANSGIVLEATTTEDTNTECAGMSAAAQQGTFSMGYNYSFETVGNDVNVTFTMLDTDKVGVVAYLWQQTPFTETMMTNTEGLTFTGTVTGQTTGTDLAFAVKFAYAGGQSVTNYFTYTVGETCGLGVETPELEASVKLYPNPASNVVTIDSQLSNISKVEVYSVLGTKVMESANTQLNVENLSDGIYMVKIYAGNKSVTKKLVIQ
ncbi:T9SS type A sorting domain-containing protein [Flavobacterium sp. DGU11]|uniref:T9SS type A sorting domain-containing protein n=1 Tax=Flavobacterium arundinis TaxID=3139143 RepID=A0ABU9HRT3_9FLAO